MGRPRKPYFRASDGWWVSRFDGVYQKLAKGWENKEEAERRFHELHLVEKVNRPADSPCHTVASVIDQYLKLNASKYCEEALEERKYYLQLFAEAHGWRAANDRDCLPIHLEQWLADHPEWGSDWTKTHAVSIVLRPFNWAVKKRILPSNPFRGVECTRGDPRRPLTDTEFQALLRATNSWCKRKRYAKPPPSAVKRRHRPSPGARFRQLLVFLRFTGMRPGEASCLEWEDIDLEREVIVLRRHKTSKCEPTADRSSFSDS